MHRIWQQEHLTQKGKISKKIRTGQQVPQVATRPNEVWAYDFVHERLEDGSAIRILTVKDEFTRRCLALRADYSFWVAPFVWTNLNRGPAQGEYTVLGAAS